MRVTDIVVAAKIVKCRVSVLGGALDTFQLANFGALVHRELIVIINVNVRLMFVESLRRGFRVGYSKIDREEIGVVSEGARCGIPQQ